MLKTKTVALLALLVVINSGPPPVAARDITSHPFSTTDLTPDPDVIFGQLPEGLRYAIMPNREPRGRVSLRLLIRAGSLHERQDQRGLAHYLEHMAFKGTENFAAGTLVEYFQNLGMHFGPDANAYTGFDRTVYQIELPDNTPGSLSDALGVLRDFADRMTIAESETEAEREIILSEKRTRDSVAFRTALAEFAFLLPETIVADRFPIGVVEVIRAAGHDDLREFYEQWYRPDHTAIVVVGETDPNTVIPLIHDHFDDFRARRPAKSAPDRGQVAGRGLTAFLHTEPEAPATRVSIQTVKPYPLQPDTVALRHDRLRRTVAFQMLTRRLERLAQEPEAPFSRGSATAYDLFDLFTNASIDLITQPESWQAALQVALNELRRALVFGFHEIELREIRANLLNAFEENARQSTTRRSRDLAEALIGALVTGRVFMHPQTELDIMRPMIESLSTDQCWAALKDLFAGPDRLIFITGNVDVEEPEYTIKDVYLQASTLKLEPTADLENPDFDYPLPDEPGDVETQRHIEDLDIHQLKFANQVYLNLKATDFSSNQVLVAVRIGGGQLLEPPNQPGLAWLASATMIRGGLGRHSADDIRRIFAGRNVEWSFTVGPDAFLFRGLTTPEDIGLQLQLLRGYLTDPGFRDEALRRARRAYEEAAISAGHTAMGVLKNDVLGFLADGDHRFGLPPPESINALDIDDVRDWLKPLLASNRLEISLVGDIGCLSNAVRTVAFSLGTLPRRAPDNPDYASQRRLSRPLPGSERRFSFPSRIPSGFSGVYWPIPDMWDMSRTRRLNVLARVFTDRMRLSIREEMGLAYSAHAVSHPSDTYSDYGWFFGLAAVGPDQAGEAALGIAAIARELYNGTISADEHQRALRPLLASLRDTIRENDYWMNSVLISAWEHPQRLEWARTMTGDYASVTVEDLADMARRFLDPTQGITIHVIPVTAETE